VRNADLATLVSHARLVVVAIWEVMTEGGGSATPEATT
jgi:hypothetical protein